MNECQTGRCLPDVDVIVVVATKLPPSSRTVKLPSDQQAKSAKQQWKRRAATAVKCRPVPYAPPLFRHASSCRHSSLSSSSSSLTFRLPLFSVSTFYFIFISYFLIQLFVGVIFVVATVAIVILLRYFIAAVVIIVVVVVFCMPKALRLHMISEFTLIFRKEFCINIRTHT